MQIHIVLCTTPTEEHARQIARALVEERLAACVSIVPGVRSIYRWENEICDDAEWMLLIKTRQEALPEMQRRLQAMHPYQVPEIIALAVDESSPAYMDWLQGVTEVAVSGAA